MKYICIGRLSYLRSKYISELPLVQNVTLQPNKDKSEVSVLVLCHVLLLWHETLTLCFCFWMLHANQWGKLSPEIPTLWQQLIAPSVRELWNFCDIGCEDRANFVLTLYLHVWAHNIKQYVTFYLCECGRYTQDKNVLFVHSVRNVRDELHFI